MNITPIPANGKVLQGPEESFLSQWPGNPALSSDSSPSPDTQIEHAVFHEQAECGGGSWARVSDSSQSRSVPESHSQRQFLFPVLLQDWHSDDLLISGFWKNTARKQIFLPMQHPLSTVPRLVQTWHSHSAPLRKPNSSGPHVLHMFDKGTPRSSVANMPFSSMIQRPYDQWLGGKQDSTDHHLPEYFINQNLCMLSNISGPLRVSF